MRLLAEFIMRGRFSAACVAIIGSWIPLLTPASIGLVTLRKGWIEGLFICLVASVLPLVGILTEDVGKSFVMASFGGVIAAYVAALILRETRSWELMLISVLVVSSGAALLVMLVDPGFVEDIKTFFQKILQGSGAESGSSEAISNDSALKEAWLNITPFEAAGMIAFGIAATTIGGAIWARWLQAIVYNPGGFRAEFHQLKLSYPVAGVMGALAVYCWFSGGSLTFWGMLLTAPMLLVGVSIIHFIVAERHWGAPAIVVFYFALVIINPLLIVIAMLGIADTWLNFRKKIQSNV